MTPFVEKNMLEAKQYENQGNYRKALDRYKNLLYITEKQTQVYSNVAGIIAKNPQVIEFDESSKKAFIHAKVYYEENKLDKAIEQLNGVIENNPFNPNLHHDIALLYAQAQDYQKAINHMNTYLALLPNANDAQSIKDEMIKWEFKLKGE